MNSRRQFFRTLTLAPVAATMRTRPVTEPQSVAMRLDELETQQRKHRRQIADLESKVDDHDYRIDKLENGEK